MAWTRVLNLFGAPIKKGYLSANLLKATLLPSAIAIIKCDVHTGGSGNASKGNAKTDEAEKVASISPNVLLVSQNVAAPADNTPSLKDVAALQAAVDVK